MPISNFESTVLSVSLALVAFASEGLGQAPTPQIGFGGSISIPVDLKNLHPDVGKVVVECEMSQTGPPGSNTVVHWPGPVTAAGPTGPDGPANFQAIQAPVSGGAVHTTLVSHFTASRSGVFAPGELWGFRCVLKLVGRAGSTSGEIEVTPGVGPTFQGMAQLASGNTSVQGSFILK